MPPLQQQQQRTILLVDDDHEILESMRTVLENKGFRILAARDGNCRPDGRRAREPRPARPRHDDAQEERIPGTGEAQEPARRA